LAKSTSEPTPLALTKDVRQVVTLLKSYKGISTSAILGLKWLVIPNELEAPFGQIRKMLITIETGAGLVAIELLRI